MSSLDIPVGSKVWVDLFPFRHFGIYLGGNHVAHCSKKSRNVCIETISEFSGDREINFQPPQGHVDVISLRSNAFGLAGKEYSLLSFNCEHFANLMMANHASCRQLKWGALGAVGAALCASAGALKSKQIALLSIFGGLAGVLLANSQD